MLFKHTCSFVDFIYRALSFLPLPLSGLLDTNAIECEEEEEGEKKENEEEEG